jgi:hypothetical protein
VHYVILLNVCTIEREGAFFVVLHMYIDIANIQLRPGWGWGLMSAF